MGHRRRSAVAINIAAVWLLGVMVQGSLAQISQSCLSNFGALADPCDPYFTPGNTATPLPSCCTPFGALLASDPTCICDVIVAAAAGGTFLNRTRLVEIFVQCQLDVPASATFCLPAFPPSVTPSISSPPPPIVTPSPPIVTPSPPIVTPSPPIVAPSPPPTVIVTPSPPPTVIVTPPPSPPLPRASPPPLTRSPPPPLTPSTPSTLSRPPPPPPSTRSTPSPPSTLSTPPPPPSTGLFGLRSAGNSLLHGSSLLLSSGFMLLTLLATFII